MNEGFVKIKRSTETLEIIKDPKAFVLLTQIALRAKRTDGFSAANLDPGQALIGDYQAIGLSEQEYRSAKQRLERHGLATFKGTNKGTIATLCDTRVYDINIHPGNDQSNGQTTIKQRSSNDQTTTNKNVKNIKNERGHAPANDIPTRQQVAAYFREQGEILEDDIPLEAQKFVNHYADMNWRKNRGQGERIDNWHRQAGTWTANYKQYNRDRLNGSPQETDGYEVYR